MPLDGPGNPNTFALGDFVSLNGRVGVVVATGDDLGEELADHLAVWFGHVADGSPEVWTVPAEYVLPRPEPTPRH